jgi:hypothetical protein
MKINNGSEPLNRAFTVMKQEVRENISSKEGAMGRVEDHQLEDIVLSLSKILSPEDFSAVCLFENVDLASEALLQQMYYVEKETVDPILIPNLIQIRSTHNSSKVF